MKKTLKVVLCLALAALMLCSAVVFAAEGDLDVLADTGVTITGTGGTLTVTVPTSMATSGTQYVVLVVKAKNVPATADDATKLLAAAKAGTATYDVGEDTILYIDQNAATATGITFTGKPKSGGDAIIVLGGGAEPVILGVIKGHGVTVKGKVSSFNQLNPVTIQLKKGANVAASGSIAAAGTTEGMFAKEQDFEITGVAADTYDLVVTKTAHLSYTIKGVVVGGDDLDLTAATNKPYALITLYGGDVQATPDDGCNAFDMRPFKIDFKAGVPSTETPNTDITGDGAINAFDMRAFKAAFKVGVGVEENF